MLSTRGLNYMNDTSRTNAELIEELSVLNQRIQNLEQLVVDHQKTVETLKESEGKYRLAFESTSDGIFTVDHDFKISSITPSVERQLGYKVEEIINRPIQDLNLLTSESLTRAVSDVIQVLSGVEIKCAVYEFIAKDGTRKIGEVTGTPIIREGNILGVTAVIRDITEHKLMDEALRYQNELQRTILDSIPVMVALFDHDGNYQLINRCWQSTLGWSLEEMLHHKDVFAEFYPDPKYRKSMLDHIKRAAGTWSDFKTRRRDGHVLDTSWFNVRLSDGSNIGIGIDVTHRKQAEEELCRNREAAEQLAEEMAVIAEIGRLISSTLHIDEVYERFTAEVRKLIDFNRLAISLVNFQENTIRIAYVSGVAMSSRRQGDSLVLEGTLSEEIIRTRTGMLIQPENICEIVERFPPLAPTFQKGFRSLMAIPLIYRNDAIGVMHFRSKKPNAYTKQDLRLAERIGMQIAGAIANAQLFKDLSKTEKSLRESERRLQRAEKMEALGQLAGGVAHDLNNVLGILTGYSELLLEAIPEGSRSRIYVDKILQSTEKGAAIINDLLTLARRGVTVSDVINLNDVVSGFLKTPMFEKMKDYHPWVTFRTEYDENLPNIIGSPIHLEKAVMNLVSNAAEAISRKGKVTIRTESRYLDKPVRGYDEIKEGDYAVLTVSDTGMGISAENREKIFEPFYTKKKMGRSGTGLGLAIVWGTVKDHHGYIDLQTKVGKGTTFTLYFPATREVLITPLQKEHIEQYLGKGESVLVVDDIAEQRDIAFRLLTRLGYEVHLVSSGEEAVEYLKENKADILVLDMIMAPGIDGFETYERILEVNPKQKTIIVSGFSETEQVRKAQEIGAGVYVKKPYTMEKIGVAIRDELLKGNQS